MNRHKLLIQSALCSCLPLVVFTTQAEIAHSSTIDNYKDYLTAVQAETISQGPTTQKENERTHIASEVRKAFPNISDTTMNIILSGICAHVNGMNHIEEHLGSEDHNDPHAVLHDFLTKLKTWLKDSEGTPHEQYIMQSKITPLYPDWIVERNEDGTFSIGNNTNPESRFTLSSPLESTYGSEVKISVNMPGATNGTINIRRADGNTALKSFTTQLNGKELPSDQPPASFTSGQNTLTIQRLSAGDYIVEVTANEVTNSTNITVTPQELSISGLTVSDKEYDGTVNAMVSGRATLNGILYDDNVSLTGRPSATFASQGVNAYDVFITGLSLSGVDASNYRLSNTPTRANIIRRQLDIDGLFFSKEYDKNTSITPSGTPRLSGMIAGEENKVTLTGTPTFRFDSANAGNNKTVFVYGYNLEGDAAENYTIVDRLTGTISPRTVTATFDIEDKVFDGENDATIQSVILNGVLAGDDVRFQGNAYFDRSTPGVHNVIFDPAYLTGAQAINYTLAPITMITATIAEDIAAVTDIEVTLDNQGIPTIDLGDPFRVTGSVTGLTPGVPITLPITYVITGPQETQIESTIFVEVEGDDLGSGTFEFDIDTQDMWDHDPGGAYTIDVTIEEAEEGPGYSEDYNYAPATRTYEVFVNDIAEPEQNIEVVAGDAVMYGTNSTVTVTSLINLADVALEIRDAQNNIVNGYQFSINNGANWLDAGVLSLTAETPTEILIQGLDAGTYTVHVTEGEITGNAELTVNPIPVQIAFAPPATPEDPVTVLVGDGDNNPIDGLTFNIDYDVLFGNYPDGYEGDDPFVLQAQLIAENVTTVNGVATFDIDYDFGGAEPGVYTIFITSASNTNYVFDIIEAQAFMFDIGEVILPPDA